MQSGADKKSEVALSRAAKDYLGGSHLRDAACELVAGDWDSWGDLRLNLSGASIRVWGEVGGIAAATIAQTIGTENYADFLAFIKGFIDNADPPAEQKLHYILRGGANTVNAKLGS